MEWLIHKISDAGTCFKELGTQGAREAGERRRKSSDSLKTAKTTEFRGWVVGITRMETAGTD